MRLEVRLDMLSAVPISIEALGTYTSRVHADSCPAGNVGFTELS